MGHVHIDWPSQQSFVRLLLIRDNVDRLACIRGRGDLNADLFRKRAEVESEDKVLVGACGV